MFSSSSRPANPRPLSNLWPLQVSFRSMEIFDPDPSIHRSLLSMTFFARAEDSFTPTQKHIFKRLMEINGPVLNDDLMSPPNSAQAGTIAIAVNYLQQKLT